MGITMEVILLQNNEIPGFILSILAGCSVYIVSSLVLGTFENEDYIILRSVRTVFPGKSKSIVDFVIAGISSFKQNGRH
jgi:hypothetical protein